MRIQSQTGTRREDLLKYLMEGICQVSFIKVKDGSYRAIYCTLNLGFIPKQFENSVKNTLDKIPEDSDLVPIWDVSEGKWKSFRISKMNYFLTSDELVSENKVGHNTFSRSKQLLEERKQKELQKFTERVEKLREQAEDARKTINGELENED